MVKAPPAMLETWVQSLGWEDPLEEGMATHSSILAWRIPWTEEPGGLQSTGVTKSQTRLSDKALLLLKLNRTQNVFIFMGMCILFFDSFITS